MGVRRLLPLMMSLCLLTGCAGAGTESGEELAFRSQKNFAHMTACSGQCKLTADYGQRVSDFVVDFTYDTTTGACLTLREPAEAAGVTARLTPESTQMCYGDFCLDTGPLTPGGISPLEALPTLYDQLAHGYISAWEGTGETLTLTFREENAQPGAGPESVICLDTRTGYPLWGELFYDGARVLRAQIAGFSMTTDLTLP